MTTPPSKTKKHRSEQRQRHKILRCRVLPHERDEIQRIAQNLGMSTAELLRSRALGQEITPSKKPLPSPDRQVLARLIGEIGKIGSNINQLARLANMGRSVTVPESHIKALLTMTRLADRLTRVMR